MSIDDKSYHCDDFKEWFYNECEALEGDSYSKVYSRDERTIKPVLDKFLDITSFKYVNRDGSGYEKEYHRNKYRYEVISKSLKSWVPEVLLLPSEISDTTGTNLVERYESLASRIDGSLEESSNFIATVILHSIIRSSSLSQPIPATLHVDIKSKGLKTFDNVHIVKRDGGSDELWLGVSRLAKSSKIEDSIDELFNEFDDLLDIDFSNHQEIILDIKENRHLFKHDIDEVLSSSSSLEANANRFRFVLFLGYESEHLSCDKGNGQMVENYKERVKKEAETRFSEMLDKLSGRDSYFDSLVVELFFYPFPCVDRLVKSVEMEFSGVANGS